MDNSIWSILDVIFVGAGIYVLYAWVMMKTKGEINDVDSHEQGCRAAQM